MTILKSKLADAAVMDEMSMLMQSVLLGRVACFGWKLVELAWGRSAAWTIVVAALTNEMRLQRQCFGAMMMLYKCLRQL